MGRAPRRWRGATRILTGAAVVALAACSNDLDALFCEPDCPVPDAGAEDGEPPILPRLPDEAAVPACEACVEQNCWEEQERASCLSDLTCAAPLKCWGTCGDPGCSEECRGIFFGERYDQNLLECTYFGQCAAECQSGYNWGCTGDFNWPEVDSLGLSAHVRFAPTIALAGSTARACPSAGCDDSVERVPLDAANGADLELPTTTTFRNFSGFFELERDEPGSSGIHNRIFYSPLANGVSRHIDFQPDWLTTLLLGWVPSSSSAALWAYVYDCTLVEASGRVRVELLERPTATVLYASSVAELEGNGAFFPELSVSGDTELVTVQAIVLGDEVVAERQIPIRAGWTSHVFLTPSSRNGQ